MLDIKAKMFNRRASGPNSMPDKVIGHLGISPGDIIADIGSGGGYFSNRFANMTGNAGKVYAVDTDPGLLNYVRRSGKNMGITLVETILTDGFPASLPKGRVDLVFLRNVYHHLPDAVAYFTRMKEYLGPKGKVVIIDYREKSKGISFHTLFKHEISQFSVVEAMKKAGYVLDASFDFLPEQFFLVFKADLQG